MRELDPGKFSGELIRSETAERFYCMLLGVNVLPESRGQLPTQVVIPRLALGNLEEAILATSRQDSRERAQSTCWDIDAKYAVSRLAVGGKYSVRHPWPAKFNSRNPKTLLEYHTHPSPPNYPPHYMVEFSESDVMNLKMGLPTYIDLVGSEYGVTALLQTTETLKFRGPNIFGALRTGFHLLRRGYDNSRSQGATQEIAEILEDEGWGYYTWRPARGVRRNSLEQGLVLDRFLAK